MVPSPGKNTKHTVDDFLLKQGLPALFILSFLAATVLPLGSEWLLVALIANGYSFLPILTAATLGNTLGACTTYVIGFYGSLFLFQRVLRIDRHTEAKARRFYKRYGVWSLLLSWVPIIGDPLCLLAGLLKTRWLIFLPLVIIGKLGRYLALGTLATIFSS
ncbi:MAG: DedA family protein [Desulfobulbaceae bacterium]|uniref:DedA family protein n=1 Tax=Candidatus Desulfatifera sulfidica TaxID=2841691 RepID=A0A8J6N8K1_9BACT|nr:DedA family protein [Candidatus Desulfatifera sulfidica]